MKTTALLARLRRAVSFRDWAARRRAVPKGYNISRADMERDVIVTGYYGAGNFGDDLIAQHVLELACRAVSPERVAVDAPPGSYLERWFPGVKCIPLELFAGYPARKERKLLFGGGGLFHAFPPTTPANLWGLHKATIHRQWQRLGGQHWSAARKFAFCVGVGPLEGKGARWITGELLKEFEHISVRDDASADILAELGIGNAVRACDVSVGFAGKLRDAMRSGPKPRTLGIVVRGWKHPPAVDGLIVSLLASARLLRTAGWEVEFVSFQSGEYDSSQHLITRLLRDGGEAIREWSPEQERIPEFCDYMRRFAVLVTMRAHGVFLGAYLGAVPIAVVIEPKLAITASACGFQDRTVSITVSPAEIADMVTNCAGESRSHDWSAELRRLNDEGDCVCKWLQS